MLQTWGLIFGASEFPNVGQWNANDAFLHSAKLMRQYMTHAGGLGMLNHHIKDLFNSDLNAQKQLEAIQKFVAGIEEDDDLIVFYVGHGGFLRNQDQDFYLAIRQMHGDAEMATALRFDAFAEALKRCVARVYLVLDCCFAAEAVRHLQGDLFNVRVQQAMPARGIAVLAAASKDRAAIAPAGRQYTMFSECLFGALAKPAGLGRENFVSLRELSADIDRLVATRFRDQAVRPEIHTPYQPEGDIADLKLFRIADDLNASDPPREPPRSVLGSISVPTSVPHAVAFHDDTARPPKTINPPWASRFRPGPLLWFTFAVPVGLFMLHRSSNTTEGGQAAGSVVSPALEAPPPPDSPSPVRSAPLPPKYEERPDPVGVPSPTPSRLPGRPPQPGSRPSPGAGGKEKPPINQELVDRTLLQATKVAGRCGDPSRPGSAAVATVWVAPNGSISVVRLSPSLLSEAATRTCIEQAFAVKVPPFRGYGQHRSVPFEPHIGVPPARPAVVREPECPCDPLNMECVLRCKAADD